MALHTLSLQLIHPCRSQEIAEFSTELAAAKDLASHSEQYRADAERHLADLQLAIDAKATAQAAAAEHEQEVHKLELQTSSLQSALEENLKRLRENTTDSNSVDKRLMIKLIVNYFKVKVDLSQA